jgi:hypothetical protein
MQPTFDRATPHQRQRKPEESATLPFQNEVKRKHLQIEATKRAGAVPTIRQHMNPLDRHEEEPQRGGSKLF